MTVHYADDWLTVYLGDCREVMATMEPESVHCVVTSPPYWGLRDYGTATWVGGDEACDHKGPPQATRVSVNRNTGNGDTDAKNTEAYRPFLSTCGKCGAIRQDGQLGLEPTPEQYVENMVAVFREVRRVLRSDGTVWLNLGDSYGGGPGAPSDKSTLRGNGHTGGGPKMHAVAEVGDYAARGVRSGNAFFDFKPKDLVGIPWLVALALRADGWYLRSDIIWSKPNPMPESVTDRPTKAHEYLFLLSKSPRYYFDSEAVREAVSPSSDFSPRGAVEDIGQLNPSGLKRQSARLGNGSVGDAAGRNIRSVWTIATQPYPGAHFATFPPKLVEPCIKAGTSAKGVCPECGAPWERIVEREGGERYATGKSAAKNGQGLATAFSGYTDGSSAPTFITTGWQPTCRHDGEPVQATVLDPFAGSGTTAMVAQSLSRRAVLIDLNADYLGQVMERNRAIPLGLGGDAA